MPLPEGWDEIPGARGCTPQSCAFRDHHADLLAAGAERVFGLSTQDTDYQREAAERLHLPFPLLSDAALRLTTALRLPAMLGGGRHALAANGADHRRTASSRMCSIRCFRPIERRRGARMAESAAGMTTDKCASMRCLTTGPRDHLDQRPGYCPIIALPSSRGGDAQSQHA